MNEFNSKFTKKPQRNKIVRRFAYENLSVTNLLVVKSASRFEKLRTRMFPLFLIVATTLNISPTKKNYSTYMYYSYAKCCDLLFGSVENLFHYVFYFWICLSSRRFFFIIKLIILRKCPANRIVAINTGNNYHWTFIFFWYLGLIPIWLRLRIFHR